MDTVYSNIQISTAMYGVVVIAGILVASSFVENASVNIFMKLPVALALRLLALTTEYPALEAGEAKACAQP
jgi:hypothetical protein